MKPRHELTESARIGDLEGIRKAIDDGADPKYGESWALRLAAKGGHLECVEFLIPLSDTKSNYSAALRWAMEEAQAECCKALVGVSDIEDAKGWCNSTVAYPFLQSVMQNENLKAKHLHKHGEHLDRDSV